MFKNLGIVPLYRRELQSYFKSPLAYAIAGVFWLLSGFFFVVLLLGPDGIIQRVLASEQMAAPLPSIDMVYLFLTSIFGLMGSLVLFILPILSMGLYAEERKLGTLELLATSPIANWGVAVGKLLGVTTFFTTLLVPLAICQIIVISATNPPIPPTIPLLAYVALILLAASILSLGMFISSLTESTILAAILTFALVFFLWVMDLIGKNAGGWLGDILTHLSLLRHYENLIKGVLDPSSIVMFFSYIVIGVFLTAQSIEALRFLRR